MQLQPRHLARIALFVAGALLSHNAIAASFAEPPGSFMPSQGTPFYQNIVATGESVSNLGGGLQTGTAYNALTLMRFSMNGPVIGLPEGGRFRVGVLAVASGQSSARLIGDIQGASNIDAKPNLLLYDIWYRQDFSALPLQLRFGIIDMNEYFDVTDSASNLLNSSFGVDAALAENLSLSIYPKPGTGMMLHYGLPSGRFLLGVFSGDPAHRSAPFHSGGFVIGEWQHALTPTSHFKLGSWQCNHCTSPIALPRISLYGLYGSIEYQIGDNATNPWAMFLRLASTHGNTTLVPRSLGIGINAPGLFTSLPNDVFSAGITQAQFNNGSAETSYELTYIWQLNQHFSVQPDFQYIHHPSGNLPDARVLIFRLSFSDDTHFTKT